MSVNHVVVPSAADCCGMVVCSYSVDAWGPWAEGIRSAGLRKGQQVAALNCLCYRSLRLDSSNRSTHTPQVWAAE